RLPGLVKRRWPARSGRAFRGSHHCWRVRARQRESAQFLSTMLGPFLAVETGKNVSLDFADDHGPVSPQHPAFLVSESDVAQIFGRIRDPLLPYRADRANAAGRDQRQQWRQGCPLERSQRSGIITADPGERPGPPRPRGGGSTSMVVRVPLTREL